MRAVQPAAAQPAPTPYLGEQPQAASSPEELLLSFLWRFLFVVTYRRLLQVPCIELLLVAYANRADGGKYER